MLNRKCIVQVDKNGGFIVQLLEDDLPVGWAYPKNEKTMMKEIAAWLKG